MLIRASGVGHGIAGGARSRTEEHAIHRSVPHDRIPLLAWPADRGLGDAEARDLRERFGSNQIVEAYEPAWKALTRETLRDPMLWFLAATSALHGLLGEVAEAWTLLAATLPLVAMDAVLHRRTQASIAGLRSRLVARTTVMRDGRWVELASDALVPGDRVRVHAGETFPADGLILEGAELQADESVLTGESLPVRKRPVSRAGTRIATGADQDRAVDAIHWAQAGTRLLMGEAVMRVLLTGGETLYGEIVRSSRSGPHTRTALQRSVDRVVHSLLFAAVSLCLVVAVARLRQGFGWGDAGVSALTLAVAALPEEFPVILAVFLGVGVHRLAHRGALVRRSTSVENIGRITCICSDKTGTITRGELQLTHLYPATGITEARLGERAARASRAESGDPLDEAILAASAARGWTSALQSGSWEPLATYPFTEDRRRETHVARGADGAWLAVTKGAPELVLSLCNLEASEREAWEARVAEWASEGHKLIACASATCSGDAEPAWRGDEPTSQMTFEGLLAFEDPVRDGVADAVAQCREAAIQVVMVTGDHRATAAAVARQIGLGGRTPRIVSGSDLDSLLGGPDAAGITSIDVVVRALPAQKLRLVKALQAKGQIVAVTGDGVNDVPALQAADIGIAMSERASRSAREAAAIVLLDDCFATVVAAIAEGRQLFWNLKLSFRYLLMIHIPLVTTAALIPLFGYPLLFQPIHIVWLELMIHPSALLAFQELPAPGRLAATRERAGQSLFSPREWGTIALVGGLLAAIVSFGFVRGIGSTAWIEHGRSLALATLCTASACAVGGLSKLRTRASRWVVAGTLAATAFLIETPSLSTRLHVTQLHAGDWAIAATGGALAILPLLVEAALAPRRGKSRSG